MLSDNMSGNYEIICGHCGHTHYRVIKNGVVIDDQAQPNVQHNQSRWSKNVDRWTGDTIHVMPGACSQERRKMGTVAQLRAAEAAGIHT